MTNKNIKFLKEFYELLLKYNAEISLTDCENWIQIKLLGEPETIRICRCFCDKDDIYNLIKEDKKHDNIN